MTCAVVEHSNGKITHHTNVASDGVSQTRGIVCVKLKLTNHSEKIIDSGVAVKLVDGLWLSNNSQFNVPNEWSAIDVWRGKR